MQQEHELRHSGSSQRFSHWVFPVSITSLGALLAFLTWTLPNWQLLSYSLAHFATLWALPANRRVLLVLLVKGGSPLLVALLFAACLWLFATLQSFVGNRAETLSALTERAEPAAPGEYHAHAGAVAFPLPFSAPPLPVEMVKPLPRFDQADAAPDQPGSSHGQRKSRPARSDQAVPPGANALSPHAAALIERRRRRFQRAPAPETIPGEGTEQAHTPPPTLPELHDAALDIRLLKTAQIILVGADGHRLVMSFTAHVRRVQLLAYLGWQWQQQARVNRETIMEQVFGHGLPDEKATPEKLASDFNSHRKLLRRDIRAAIAQLNAQAGREVFPPDLDIFANQQQLWWLSPLCRVTDLETVMGYHQVIEAARMEGRLVEGIPDEVKAACDALLAAYPGDFLADLLRDYAIDFEPLHTSWVRKPFTLYRDAYLEALWYAAEYEMRAGTPREEDAPSNPVSTEGDQRTKKSHESLARAAQFYYRYAMKACESRFDTKVTFGKPGRQHGERVIMSERALRRCLMLYGSIGSTHLVDQAYSTYTKQMRRISADAWNPDEETLKELEQAKSRTGQFRLPAQVSLHDLGDAADS